MTDSFRCPACEGWNIIDGAEKMHEHQSFCDECMKYLIGYIKYQKKLKQQHEDQKKGIFQVG